MLFGSFRPETLFSFHKGKKKLPHPVPRSVFVYANTGILQFVCPEANDAAGGQPTASFYSNTKKSGSPPINAPW